MVELIQAFICGNLWVRRENKANRIWGTLLLMFSFTHQPIHSKICPSVLVDLLGP